MIGELGWDAKFIPKGPKGGKNLQLLIFFKRYLSVGRVLKKRQPCTFVREDVLTSRLDASENELSDEAGAVRMVKRLRRVRPKLQAGVCLVSGLQSICHTREGAISMIRILEYGCEKSCCSGTW